MDPLMLERFWANVRKSDGCWEWAGPRDRRQRSSVFSYGVLTVNGRTQRVHRLSWEIHNGPIPPGLIVCHHCDNPPCVRPDHLYVGTQLDNARDRDTRGRHRNQRKLACVNGHLLTTDNLAVGRTDRGRECKICKLAYQARYRLRQREKAA